MKALIANIGERDLYYNVGTDEQPNFCHFEFNTPDCAAVASFLKCPPGARYMGQQILNGLFDARQIQYNRLRFPILYPVLKHMTEKKDKFCIFLTVTDQPKDVAENYRSRDTLYSGEILKKLIPRYFSVNEDDIYVKKYSGNPSVRDQAYTFYKIELAGWVPQEISGEVYLSLSGGVPALNDALLYRALQLYKKFLHPFNTQPGDSRRLKQGTAEGTLQSVDIYSFLKDIALGLIETLLERFDYSGVLDVFSTLSGVKFWSDEVEAVVRHANYRLNLKFEQAAKMLEPYKKYNSRLSHWWTKDRSLDLFEKLKELYFQAESCYECEDYTGMIWRIATIYERSQRIVGVKAIGLPVEDLMHDRRLRKKDFGIHWAPLTERLTAEGYKSLGYLELRNKIHMSIIAEYAAGLTDNEKYEQALKDIYKFRELTLLRNDVIHKMEGISQTDLNRAFNDRHEKILPRLASVLEQITGFGAAATWINPYKDINGWLKNELSS